MSALDTRVPFEPQLAWEEWTVRVKRLRVGLGTLGLSAPDIRISPGPQIASRNATSGLRVSWGQLGWQR